MVLRLTPPWGRELVDEGQVLLGGAGEVPVEAPLLVDPLELGQEGARVGGAHQAGHHPVLVELRLLPHPGAPALDLGLDGGVLEDGVLVGDGHGLRVAGQEEGVGLGHPQEVVVDRQELLRRYGLVAGQVSLQSRSYERG